MRQTYLLLVLSLLPAFAGCRSKDTAAKVAAVAPSGTAAAPPVAPFVTPEEVTNAVNHGHEPVYSGPIGRVTGTIHASGDAAPVLADLLAKMRPGKCEDGRAFYGKLFREGPGRELADVLVGVTEYKGYVPAPSNKKAIVAKGCAYESRTIALEFGQSLEIFNKGPETFIPELIVSRQAALQVAIPGGAPVRLYPDHVGPYVLTDRSHDFVHADVFVLKYATTAVTGLDGKFDIDGIPAGDVSVSAYLPSTRQVVTARVKVVAGEAATVDLTIPFTAAAPAPSAAP